MTEGHKSLPQLHIGCFDRAVAGWINTDITPHLWVAKVPLLAAVLRRSGLMGKERFEQHRRGTFVPVRYMNATRRFPYPDNSIQAIFSSHFLEHLFHDEARFCLSEVHRVLRPGGVCRIVVPDLDKIVTDYDSESPERFLRMMFEYPERKSAKNLHHWMYNESYLSRICLEIGFGEVFRREYRQGLCPDLDQLDNRPDESLYLEAIK